MAEHTEPTRPAAPEPSQDSEAGPAAGPSDRAADRARTRLSGRAMAAGIGAGAAAVLLASAALIAVSVRSRNVSEELASLREELAKAPSGPGAAPAQLGELKARLAKLSDQVASLERALSEERAGRVPELEKALREAQAARRAGEEALLAKGMRGPLHVFMGAARGDAKEARPGGAPLEPDRELARALGEMARVAQFASAPEWAGRLLKNIRRHCESQQKQLRRQHEEERRRSREWLERLHETVRKETIKIVDYIYSKAGEAERREDWQGALLRYRDVASVKIGGAAKMAAESRKKALEIQRKMGVPAQTERRDDRGGRKDGAGARPEGPPAVPHKPGEEVF